MTDTEIMAFDPGASRISLHVNALILTLDATWGHRGLLFAGFACDAFREDLRAWHAAIGHHTGAADADPVADRLAALRSYLRPELQDRHGMFLNWLWRGSNREDTFSLRLWMEALTQFTALGDVPVPGLSPRAGDAILDAVGRVYLPLTRAAFPVAEGYAKEWSPYARDAQLDYNLRTKTVWDAQLYRMAYESELDLELPGYLMTLVENHAARWVMETAHAAMGHDDHTALANHFLATLDLSGLYDKRPKRLATFQRSLRPLHTHLLPGTRQIAPPLDQI